MAPQCVVCGTRRSTPQQLIDGKFCGKRCKKIHEINESRKRRMELLA